MTKQDLTPFSVLVHGNGENERVVVLAPSRKQAVKVACDQYRSDNNLAPSVSVIGAVVV